MCGRYTLVVMLDELITRFLIGSHNIPYHEPRYNIAPGQMIGAIIHDGTQNRLGELKWGLIPNWASDAKSSFKMINARAETVQSKPAFRMPFERKRCLIPADGFYEWMKIDEAGGPRKQPMRIVLKEQRLFAMAGLYDTWIGPDGNKINTCTIITTASNPFMARIHDRMPVILRQEDEALWLSREANAGQLTELLQPYPQEEMDAYAVSTAVGNVKHVGAELIEPLSHDDEG